MWTVSKVTTSNFHKPINIKAILPGLKAKGMWL